MRISPVTRYNDFYSCSVRLKENQKIKSAFYVSNTSKEISFGSKEVYVLDYYGNAQKFNSVKDAANFFNCTVGEIGRRIKNDYGLMHGFVVAYADNVETKDKTLDKEKIRQLMFNYTLGEKAPIYDISPLGELTRYENSKEAREKLGLKSKLHLDAYQRYQGHLFVRANYLDLRDDDGKIIFNSSGKPAVDTKKLNKILYEERVPAVKKAVYLIDKNGNATRFNDLKELSDKMGFSFAYINNYMRGLLPSNVHGYDILRASDIEYYDSNGSLLVDDLGNPILNQEKIEQLLSSRKSKEKTYKREGVRLVDHLTNEEFEFESKAQAAKFLGISRQRFDIISKTRDYYNNYTIYC